MAPLEDEGVDRKKWWKNWRTRSSAVYVTLRLSVKRVLSPEDSPKCTFRHKIEFEAHCRTHVPYRSWCPICVQAKKRNPPHVTAKMGDHRGTPVISMDYTFLNYKHGADNNPVLIVTDSQSGGLWASPVVRKGNYNSYISKRIASILD